MNRKVLAATVAVAFTLGILSGTAAAVGLRDTTAAPPLVAANVPGDCSLESMPMMTGSMAGMMVDGMMSGPMAEMMSSAQGHAMSPDECAAMMAEGGHMGEDGRMPMGEGHMGEDGRMPMDEGAHESHHPESPR
jgi:hypothetical protein